MHDIRRKCTTLDELLIVEVSGIYVVLFCFWFGDIRIVLRETFIRQDQQQHYDYVRLWNF